MNESCRQVLEELQVFLDGECGRSLEEAVREHLGQCLPCLDRAEFQREVRALVAAKCRDVAPSKLRDRVIDTLGRR